MIISNTAFSQMIFEKRKQKIGFSASADSCDYFYKTVMCFGYQFVQIIIPFYFNTNCPPVFSIEYFCNFCSKFSIL